MFSVTLTGADRVDVLLDGKLDEAEMAQALDEFYQQARYIRRGQMLYRVGEFRLPTVRAVWLELSRMPKMLGLIRNFDRAAVLADQRWLRVISELEGLLIPGLKIKAFALADEDAAEEWLESDD